MYLGYGYWLCLIVATLGSGTEPSNILKLLHSFILLAFALFGPEIEKFIARKGWGS